MRKCTKAPFYYGYVVLAAIWMIYFCNVGFILYGTTTINAKMISVESFSPAVLGKAVSLCTIMQGVAGPIVGYLVVKKGVKTSLLIGNYLLISASLLLAFFVSDETMFILVYGLMIGMGIGMAGINVTQSTVNFWFNNKKAIAMSIALSAGGVGGFIAPLIIKSHISNGDWTYGWVIIALMCTISLLLTITLIVNKPSDIGEIPDGISNQKNGQMPVIRSTPALTFRKVLKNSAIYFILINLVSRTAIYYSFIGHMVLFLTKNEIFYSDAVYTISIISITSLVGRFLAGVIPERFIKPNINLGIGNIMMAMGMLVIVGAMPAIAVIYLGSIIFGIGLGFAHIALPLTLSRFYGEENFAMINGNISPLNYIIGALGPLAVGLAANRTNNYTLPFLLLCGFALLGSITAFCAKQPFFIKYQ